MHVKHAVLVGLIFIEWHPSGSQAGELSLTHQDALRIALEGNPEVVAAKAAWEAAKARAVQAGAFPNPELQLEYEELPSANHLGAYGERNLGATQTIEFPLKWWRRRRSSQQAARATQLSVLETTRHEISLRVKFEYARVLLAQERLEYNRENLHLIHSFVKKTHLRRESGDVPALDVIRAEVEMGRATNRLTQIQSDLDEARATLNVLLGRDTRATFRIAGNLDYQPSAPKRSDVEKLAFRRRPEMRGANSALASAVSRQGAARVALIPDVRVGVFRQTIDGPAGKEDFWRVGFGLELPLWGAVKQRGEVAQANADAAQAAAQKTQIRLQVLLDVERALLELRNADEQVQLFQEDISTAAERAYEVAIHSYREGKATYLDVLEAHQALIEVREECASALFDHRVALAHLEWATGGELDE